MIVNRFCLFIFIIGNLVILLNNGLLEMVLEFDVKKFMGMVFGLRGILMLVILLRLKKIFLFWKGLIMVGGLVICFRLLLILIFWIGVVLLKCMIVELLFWIKKLFFMLKEKLLL